MKPELKKLVDNVVTIARGILAEGEELLPVFHVGRLDPPPTMAIVATPFSGPDPIAVKDNAAREVRKIAADSNAQFIIFVSEAWSIPHEDAEEYQRNPYKYPKGISSHPNKFEVVHFSVETKEVSYFASCRIARDGKSGSFADPEFHETESRGRFSKLLP